MWLLKFFISKLNFEDDKCWPKAKNIEALGIILIIKLNEANSLIDRFFAAKLMSKKIESEDIILPKKAQKMLLWKTNFIVINLCNK